MTGQLLRQVRRRHVYRPNSTLVSGLNLGVSLAFMTAISGSVSSIDLAKQCFKKAGRPAYRFVFERCVFGVARFVCILFVGKQKHACRVPKHHVLFADPPISWP